MTKAQKRFAIAVPLGVLFGFLCAYGASQNMWPNFWGSAMMWFIVASRFLTGFMIACVGVYTVHPLLWFKLNALKRGAWIGAITSLPMATGSMIWNGMSEPTWGVFFGIIFAGMIIGMIIDFCATKWGGEGKNLIGK